MQWGNYLVKYIFTIMKKNSDFGVKDSDISHRIWIAKIGEV